MPSNDLRAPTHESVLHGWWRDPGRIVVAAAGSPADLPGRWEAVESMDSRSEAGAEVWLSTTPTASLCRFIPNASKEKVVDQQNAMLGMLRRLGILGPIVWAAYWGDSDLVDCERLWVLEGELADLYAYLKAGISSETGMPELQLSSFVKLALDSASAAATPKSSRESPFSHSDDYRNVTFRSKTYSLTSQQAAFIKHLHEAHENGHPDVSIAHILEELENRGTRWQDTFRSNPEAKKALIETGSRKGTLRLNL